MDLLAVMDLSPWWGLPLGMVAFYIWVEHFSHRLSVKMSMAEKPEDSTTSFIPELWADGIVNTYKKTLVLSALYPELWNQWKGIPWWDRVLCGNCGHVGVTVFNTERFQDMNATIEIHRVGCNKCSLVGNADDYTEGSNFRTITDFEEYQELKA